jgi:MoaA/NifB/PqqE/SkfB family radical SAM enzyme
MIKVLDEKYDRARFSIENPNVWERLSALRGLKFVEYRKKIKEAEAGKLMCLPCEIFIKTTYNCNHACPRCLHGGKIFPQGDDYFMSFDTVKKVLDESAEKGVFSTVFTGGEPTLHPQLPDFLQYAASKGFPDISVVTNGSELSEDIINALVNYVTRINISIDAITKETYKKVRGVDDYDKVLDRISVLLNTRKDTPLLSVSFVLSEQNMHELDAFVAQWEHKADGGIKIYPYKNVYSIIDEEFKNVLEKGATEKIKDIERPTVVSGDSAKIMSDYSIKCTIPWYRCHIGIRGEIQACTTVGFCDHPQMYMGNIHDMTFEEAWNSPDWENLRQITRAGEYHKHSVCKRCQASVRREED